MPLESDPPPAPLGIPEHSYAGMAEWVTPGAALPPLTGITPLS
jgi:hypothetical protein